jgi:uncharacterized membrane protein
MRHDWPSGSTAGSVLSQAALDLLAGAARAFGAFSQWPSTRGHVSFDRTVPVAVLTETIIARPREVVARYAADPDNAPEWYENIRSVEWQTERPVRVGSRLAFVAHFLGRRLAYTYVVEELTAGERMRMQTSQGPFPMQTLYEWSDHGEGQTRMTLRNRGEPSGFSRLVAPLMARAMRRANQKDLAKLKRLLEAG